MRCANLFFLPLGCVKALHYVGQAIDGDGIIITSQTDILEPGSESSIQIDGPGCNFSQTIGELERCVMPWSKDLTISGNLSVPGGFATSDSIQLDYKVESSATVADSQIQHYLSISPVEGQMTCGVCDGGCSAHASAGNGFTMKMLMPNAFGSRTTCQKTMDSHPRRFEIEPKSFAMPSGPPSDLGLRVSGDIVINILKSDGQSRFKQETTVKMVPPPPKVAEPTAVSSNPWAAAAMVSSHAVGLYRLSQALSPPLLLRPRNASGEALGLLGAVWELTKSGIVQALASPEAKAVNLAARQEAETGWVNAVAMRGNLLSAESPKTRVLFTAGGQHCEGGEVCRVKVDTPFKLEFRMVFDQEIVEGDYMAITSKPKVGGPAGQAIGNYIKIPTMKLPLCGEQDKEISIKIPIVQKSIKYQPLPCGRYASAVNLPPFEVSIPDFTNLRLSDLGLPRIPNVPDVVGSMPSMVVEAHITAKHKDDSVIADFIMEGGISQVKN